ncbi:MAG: DNA gyrase subunit A [Patescibacteria group bacterium]|nr:DNA gyrase subunit A [Patescibacteria group bacterium]
MERIEKKPLEEELKESYLDYAMSVIVSRALPDLRDGLKPVHRRILYAMYEDGLTHQAKFRKSATVVGACLGRYHPHGDQAVYDAAIRLAQNFSLRYPLIEGQGNLGSVDNPSEYAAMRYTEMRLSKLGEEMLRDIEKETVNFVANYDGTRKEPTVLPSPLPQLLLNGSAGIAVGVATNIPPHNLSEVCEALIYLIDHPNAEINDFLKIIKGPDFPSGGIVFGGKNLEEIYTFGRGSILIRARTEILTNEKGEKEIVIKEIPYQVSKSSLLEKIAHLVKEKKIEEIREIKDLSDKEGIRIVIKVKKQALAQKVLNRLFALTPLETPFYFNCLALTSDLEVKKLSLKELLLGYLKHREEVVRRRTQFELIKTEERIHILEGFKITLHHLNQVIALIKKSKDREEAKKNLEKEFHFDEKQAQAILEMRLYQLAHLERGKIENELKEKKEKRKELKEILSSPQKIYEVIKKEISELKEKYGDQRRTEIISSLPEEFKEEDLISDELTIVMLTRAGYIKRVSPENFRAQERGGKGIKGLEAKENDVLEDLVLTSTTTNLFLFSNKGKVFFLKTYKIPELGRTATGEAIANFLNLSTDEKISFILPLKGFDKTKNIILVTRTGIIKKVKIDDFHSIRKSGLFVINLEKNDALKSAKLSLAGEEILLFTALGQVIRFKEQELKIYSRGAKGIRGIKLRKDDEVIDLEVVDPRRIKNLKVLTFSELGFGKKTFLSVYRLQKRGGFGLKAAKVSAKTGRLIKSLVIDEKNLPSGIKGDLILISRLGQVLRIPSQSVPLLGRVSQGVRLMKFKDKNDRLAAVTLV